MSRYMRSSIQKYFFLSYRNITYVDDFYPYKYIYKFLTYMLKNFQIKYINPRTNRWTLEIFKNYISCKRSKSILIPKNFMDEMIEHFEDFKKFPCEEYYLIFSRILDCLQKVSNIVGSNCTNLQNFINFIKYRIITKNVIDSTHMDYKSIKHLTSWIALHLKKHDFLKAGIDLGKLFSIIAENINYNQLKKKSSIIVRKKNKSRKGSNKRISNKSKKINKTKKTNKSKEIKKTKNVQKRNKKSKKHGEKKKKTPPIVPTLNINKEKQNESTTSDKIVKNNESTTSDKIVKNKQETEKKELKINDKKQN